MARLLPSHARPNVQPPHTKSVQAMAASPSNRSAFRDLHIYDSKQPETELGGLCVAGGVTNKIFFSMLEIVFILDSEFRLLDERGRRLEPNGDPLQPGKYYVDGAFVLDNQLACLLMKKTGDFAVNDEPVLTRTISKQSGSRHESFCTAVRERDGRCLITGRRPVSHDMWLGLEAAHIFPLAYYDHWMQHNYDRWITLHAGLPINSVQNGLLLRSDIHQMFDGYLFAVNPDV